MKDIPLFDDNINTKTYYYYYSDTRVKDLCAAAEMFATQAHRHPRSLYVRYDSNHPTRAGAIARVVGLSDSSVRGDMDFYLDQRNSRSRGNPRHYGSKFFYNTVNHQMVPMTWDVELEFDGRGNTITANTTRDRLVWLKNYQGATDYRYSKRVKPKIERVPVHDQLGRELEVGDLVVYSCSSYSRGSYRPIIVGKVSRINAPSTVYCTNMKMKDGDRAVERRIRETNQILKLTDDLMAQLTLIKLTVE